MKIHVYFQTLVDEQEAKDQSRQAVHDQDPITTIELCRKKTGPIKCKRGVQFKVRVLFNWFNHMKLNSEVQIGKGNFGQDKNRGFPIKELGGIDLRWRGFELPDLI